MMMAEAYSCIFSYISSGFLSKGIAQTTQSKNLPDGRFKNPCFFLACGRKYFIINGICIQRILQKVIGFDSINYCDTLHC